MNENKLEIRNLAIATFLYASKVDLVGTVKRDGSIYFQFFPKDKADSLVKDYFSGKARVNPRELFARYNDLKDLIFKEK